MVSRLERERDALRIRADAADSKVAKITVANKEVTALRTQKKRLEDLCRGLTVERASLLHQLAARDLQGTASAPATALPTPFSGADTPLEPLPSEAPPESPDEGMAAFEQADLEATGSAAESTSESEGGKLED
jgi:hypothetical protein